MDGIALFSYRKGMTVLHRCPAGWKLAGLCLCTVCIFSSGMPALAALTAAAAVVHAACGFRIRETAREQLPVLWYALFMLVFSLPGAPDGQEAGAVALLPFLAVYPGRAVPVFIFTWKLLLTVTYTSFMFRTTTPLQIRQCLYSAETHIRSAAGRVFPSVRRGAETRYLSFSFSLMLTFIPSVFETWQGLDTAWKNRGGRGGMRKIKTLIPALVSVMMNKASQTDKAVKNRGGQA